MTQLFDRLSKAHQALKPFQSDYRVVFEDAFDGTSKVLCPDPNWMAMALTGGYLPPLEVYQKLEKDEQGQITNGHILHETPPMDAISEEEAIEYLIKMVIPAHVWSTSDRGNSRKFIICRANQLPGSREFRNAWTIKQEKENDRDQNLYQN